MAYGQNGQRARDFRGGYQAIVGGRGRVGQAMAEIEEAADNGDARAMALCKALNQCDVPGWRQRQIAPGVSVPCDDLVPLPLRPVAGTPTFVAGGPTTISLTGNTQKAFRGERPMAFVLRVGASAATAVPLIRGGIRVGVDPQVAQIADQPLENFTPAAFGARMVMSPADPGIDHDVDIFLFGPALAAGDTVSIFFTIFGSIWK
jgi:hypothetical protein